MLPQGFSSALHRNQRFTPQSCKESEMSHADTSSNALDVALNEYLGWTGDPVATLKAAVAADPGFILGHTTLAALHSLGGIPGSAKPIARALTTANALAGTASAQQRLHLAAANSWAEGDIEGAAAFWETALEADPADLLALRLAHDTHFYLGAGEKLRDVPLAVLPAYRKDPVRRGFVLGMAAFGLEETGAYAEAERAGREAVDVNPADSWAVHAVTHVLEMQDRADEGISWLRGLEPHWAPAAGLAVHQWWHAGLYLIELGRLDEVLTIYDAHIRPGADAQVLDLVDAAALLWRLQLLGLNVDDRWQDLVPLWRRHAEDHVLAFNDVHIALTLAGAGEDEAIGQLEESLARYANGAKGTNARVSTELGLPLTRALRAFQNGDYQQTVAIMTPLFKHLAPVGGSNAQRDLFIQTLGIAAFKTGADEIAVSVLAERRRLKAGMPRAWAGLASAGRDVSNAFPI
jgi:tetratricopeptide (TPR) repeat protein